MRNRSLGLTLFAGLSILVAACSSSGATASPSAEPSVAAPSEAAPSVAPTESAAPSESAAPQSDLKIGVVTDIGTLNDKGYNEYSFKGAEDGATEIGAPAPQSTVPKDASDKAMDAAACIGCGACVAACPNASASLFTGAKLAHLNLLPQGQPERQRRTLAMVAQMDSEGFGHCTLFGECQEACPKEISIDVISRMNRDYMKASVTHRKERVGGGVG